MKYLELNQILLEGARQTLSLLAEAGEVTTLTGEDSEALSRYLLAIAGFSNVLNGNICIDGEPLTAFSADFFRQQMAYAPADLHAEGEIVSYEPPSVQDIFRLRANRALSVSDDILNEEISKLGGAASDRQMQLIAAAALLETPILLIEDPPVSAMPYLRKLAATGRIVLLTSNKPEILAASDKIEET